MTKFWLLAALLITTWPDGSRQQAPSTTMDACLAAAEFDLNRGALSAACRSMSAKDAGFKPNWDCIQGFNCVDKQQGVR